MNFDIYILMKKVGLYIRLSEDVVNWLRRRLPAKKGSLSSYIEELIRREMSREEIDRVYDEIEKLVPRHVEALDIPKLRREAEKRLYREV